MEARAIGSQNIDLRTVLTDLTTSAIQLALALRQSSLIAVEVGYT
jgi:hypothetical protein